MTHFRRKRNWRYRIDTKQKDRETIKRVTSWKSSEGRRREDV